MVFLFFFFFLPRHVACGILVPRPGIEPRPLAVRAQSPNHWTARVFPHRWCFLSNLKISFMTDECNNIIHTLYISRKHYTYFIVILKPCLRWRLLLFFNSGQFSLQKWPFYLFALSSPLVSYIPTFVSLNHAFIYFISSFLCATIWIVSDFSSNLLSHFSAISKLLFNLVIEILQTVMAFKGDYLLCGSSMWHGLWVFLSSGF